MEFRIADTFTDSLARLSRQEQKATKTTAFDLQLDPTSNGLSVHKLDRAKDANFWSVRVAEATDTRHEIAETCLGHVVGGVVERAYRRTDYLEQRHVVMARWGKHVTGQNGQVLQIVRE